MRITTYSLRIDGQDLPVLEKIKSQNYETCYTNLSSTNKVVDMMADVFQMHLMAEEYVYLLALNSKCKIIGVFEVSHGTSNMSLINPREIMIRNLLCGASAFIIVHNHPSGELEVSNDDVTATTQLLNAGELLGIPLLDHIVIAKDNNYLPAFYSMKEHGIIH